MLRSRHASRATLASHLHAFGNRGEAGLAITNSIDLYETIEADAHHAERRTQCTGHGRRPQIRHASGEQCCGDRVAGPRFNIATFITETDSSACRIKPSEH
jgi:hypothetical protein